MKPNQLTREFLHDDEALALLQQRLRAGLPIGARDVRSLGFSLCTDRYNEVRRVALQELGLARRPRIRRSSSGSSTTPPMASRISMSPATTQDSKSAPYPQLTPMPDAAMLPTGRKPRMMRSFRFPLLAALRQSIIVMLRTVRETVSRRSADTRASTRD